MCGIAGMIAPEARNISLEALERMASSIAHRGPDGQQCWLDESQSLGMAHRRLSIIDKSAAAAQPFFYLHYVVVFNGEIYNYLELKEQLRKHGYVFTTNGDTEVIPAAYDCWGLDALQKIDGMFTIALYDKKKQELKLIRDRLGEKPLYYYVKFSQRGKFDFFYFGSEMKALWSVGVPRIPHGSMLLNYLGLGFVKQPLKQTATFFQDILSLPPGHVIDIQITTSRFSMKRWYHSQFGSQHFLTDSETHSRFDALLTESILRRLRSDVSVGTSLSGGLDSSSIAYLIHRNVVSSGSWSQCGFTAGFPGFEKDETGYAKEVATQLKLHSFFCHPNADNLVADWHKWMNHQEEPVQSSSAFIQFKVYELAKKEGITVLLDGQGADEVLAGYEKYIPWYLQTMAKEKNLAAALRQKKFFLQNGFHFSWSLGHYVAALQPEKAASWLQKKAIRQVQSIPFLHKDFLHQFLNKDTLIKPIVRHLDDILHYNTFQFGLEELLRYADRNSMAHGCEVRLPFLHHELIQFMFSLPTRFKMNEGFTKWILRKSTAVSLPQHIAWRRGKIGYEPPQQDWLSHPSVQNMISEAQKTLIINKVLEPGVLETKLSANPAHAAKNFEWRCLNAAFLFNNSALS
jgi:asparagine synthase (glutamine-hydrolysing)